ncbi:outer membrane protein assembly factor [Candidatus Sumerlaeota bacterium]|nr:outer membrane protein assembly factor [Candidatus Sumerlaeales bacterium]NLD61473.1 outer membrane protein assembly factor [Candidatus Sumerlaeota bacterium]
MTLMTLARRIRAFAVTLSVVVGSASCFASPDTIRTINFSGVSGDDLSKAQSLIATRVGTELDETTQRDDIERLYTSGLFSPDIRISMDDASDGVNLTYHLQPCPKVGQVSVSGNQQIDTKKILDEISIKSGDSYSAVTNEKLVTSVQKLYEDKGFSDAMVMVNEYAGTNDTMNVEVVVDEGTRQKVNKVKLNGNQSYTDLRLKMSNETKGSWLGFKHWFNQSKFDQDVSRLKTFYVAHGYLDAVVEGHTDVLSDGSITPVIDIQEGPRYTVGRLEVRGCTLFSRDEALKPFRGLVGKPYDSKEFARSVSRLQKLYGNEGYLTTDAEPEFHKDSSRAAVDLDVVISEGPRIYVGNVRVISRALPDDSTSRLRKWYSRFTPPPSDEIVAREVKLQPGQVYRRYDEVRTRDSLESMRIFKDVKVYDEATEDPNVRNLVVDTLTGDTGQSILGVGFGDVEGLFAYVSLVEHNLLGDATDLGFSAMIGTSAYSADFSILRRHFMESDWNARLNLYYQHTNRTGDITEKRLGSSVEFSKALSDSLSHAVRLRLEGLNYSLPDDPAPIEEINNYVAATIGYRLTKRTVDDRYMPTTGYVATGAAELGIADGLLAKLQGNYTRYFDVSNDWTIMSNTMGGVMPVKAHNVGYSDRFFMGGSRDLRGFKLYGAGQHDEAATDVPLGGSLKLVTQLEARRRITDNFALLGFVDAGLLGDSMTDISSPRMAAGVGARLRMPIATIGLDLGVPVVKKSEDQTQVIHFSMSSGL